MTFLSVPTTPCDSSVGVEPLEELSVSCVCSSNVIMFFWWRELNMFLSGDVPRNKRLFLPPPQLFLLEGQETPSTSISSQPLGEGALLEAAPGWGVQWGEGLKAMPDPELYLSTF